MSYRPLDNPPNPSGLVFYGQYGSSGVFDSSSDFTIDLVKSSLLIPDNGYIGSQSPDGREAIRISNAGDVTLSDDLSILGNLTVNGTTTTVNSTTLTVEDPIIILGSGSPTLDDNKDRGISFNYFDGSAKTGFFGYDEDVGKFTFIPVATITSETVTGDAGTIVADLEGTADFAEQLLPYAITGMPEANDINATNDYILIWDDSDGRLEKINRSTLVSGLGAMSSWTLSDGSNTETIQDGNTVLVSGAPGIDVLVSSTDTVTISLDISEYSTVSAAVDDKILTLDSDGSTHQLTTISDLAGLYAGSGLVESEGSLHINVDGSTLEISSDTLQVKDGGITFSKLADAAVQLSSESFVDNDTTLMTSAAIQDKITDQVSNEGYFNVAGSGLIVNSGNDNRIDFVGGDGLSVTEDEVDVLADGSTINFNGSNQLYVPDGGIGEDQRSRTVQTATSSANISADIVLANSSSDIELTLPAPVSGKIIRVKNINTGRVDILKNNTDTVEGTTQVSLYYQYESMNFVSDGNNWYIV